MYKLIFSFMILSIILTAQELIVPISDNGIVLNKEKVLLGKMLFKDTMLSRDDTISCESCHNLQDGGDDGLKFSVGIDGQQGSINSPTVYNAVFNLSQFWDGRAKDLQEQAAGPIENPVEMGFTFKELIPKLKKSKYKKLFNKIYKDGITKENITDAIAEFEKALITPNSPFDKYLKGDHNAISQDAKEGYQLFKTKGCISCHHGINLGSNHYNKFGLYEDIKSEQLGRYNVTKNEEDKYYFKVPTLRNIDYTAPYFHDGRTYSLKEAILIMAQYQLGRAITPKEVDKIAAFLHSLNGELPKELIEP